LQIYVNLSTEPAFVQAIASEGRSYSKSLFERALKIASERVLKSTDELKVFAKFAERVEEVRLAMDEEEITEYPDEFEVVDLSTIKSHLLSDPTDPFNRVPLKLEDVTPHVELQKRIQEFIAERKAATAAARASAITQPDPTMEIDGS
ncbi:13496_t:CDS:2, partial [Acaulospora colombiana]